MTPKVRTVMQVRTASSRLPGKAFLPVGGIPLALLAAQRAARTGEDLVVATSDDSSDDLLAEQFLSSGFQLVRGSLVDVVSRFVLSTADLADDDYCIRLTADNVFPDADLISALKSAVDLTSNEYLSAPLLFHAPLPVGISAEIFTVRALRETHRMSTLASDREHVTPYIRRQIARLAEDSAHIQRQDLEAPRCTIDTLDDYLRIASFFQRVRNPVWAPWTTLVREFAAFLHERHRPKLILRHPPEQTNSRSGW